MALVSFAALLACAMQPVAAQSEPQLEQPRLTQSAQRTEFPLEGEDTSYKYSFPSDGAEVDNAAVLQYQMNRGSNVFLSTLPNNGISQLLTVLKPCAILLPHIHPRGNELYSVISGVMSVGIAQENSALQNITFTVGPGEVMITPQGLLHYNANMECEPNAFFQTYDAADPSALGVVGAVASFNGAGPEASAAMEASGLSSVEAADFGSFALDGACLERCGFDSSGAPGDGLNDLPDTVRAMLAAATTTPAPAGAPF